MATKQDRWQDAAADARGALDTLEAAIKELQTVQKECEESFEKMGNFQQSENGQQFEAIAGVNLSDAENCSLTWMPSCPMQNLPRKERLVSDSTWKSVESPSNLARATATF